MPLGPRVFLFLFYHHLCDNILAFARCFMLEASYICIRGERGMKKARTSCWVTLVIRNAKPSGSPSPASFCPPHLTSSSPAAHCLSLISSLIVLTISCSLISSTKPSPFWAPRGKSTDMHVSHPRDPGTILPPCPRPLLRIHLLRMDQFTAHTHLRLSCSLGGLSSSGDTVQSGAARAHGLVTLFGSSRRGMDKGQAPDG